MKKILTLLLTAFAGLLSQAQICNTSGNLMIFTNYDGGPMTINVDQNISNLKIGICSYEAVRITLTGAFLNNVTAVHYAGYNGSNNNCSGPVIPTTTIIGAPSGAITTTVFAPAATITNTNGYGSIICGYSCNNNSNQGGCNTVDQVEAYFLNYFSGSTLYAHRVQYNCWNGATHSLSAGGNCCPVQAVSPGGIASSQTICAGNTPLPFTSVTSATAATGAITYSWQSSTTSASSGFSNISGANATTHAPGALSQTTYYRRAAATTTNNTVYSNVITVTIDLPPTITVTGPSSVCPGGTVTLSASGASSYTWLPPTTTGSLLPVTTGLPATYTVIAASAANCTNSAVKSVGLYPQPVITANTTLANLCTGQSVTLTAFGAAIYSWTPGGSVSQSIALTPAASDTYTVTGVDLNGCVGTETVSFNVVTTPTVVITPNSATLCSGSTVTLTASGAVNYLWLPDNISTATIAISPGVTTSYTITGNTSGCTDQVFATVTVAPSPTVTLTSSKATVCTGQGAVLTASGAVGYILLNNSAALPGNSITVSPTVTTSYSVSGTAANTCTNVGVRTLTVDACAGLETINKNTSNELKLFPNPSKGDFTMVTDVDARFEIINSIGQVVRTVSLDEKNDHKALITNLPGGVYFVSSLNDKNAPKRKVIVTR